LNVTAFSDSEEKAAGAMEWVLGNAMSMEQKFTEQGEREFFFKKNINLFLFSRLFFSFELTF